MNLAFFILSSMTPYSSHKAFTTNQNWSGSSFSTPLNTGSFIVLTILLRGGGGGGMGKVEGEDGETSGGVGGGGMHGILCFIRLIALLGETFTSASLPPHGGEIKGPVSSSVLPSFL